jgi:hypothetical protein
MEYSEVCGFCREEPLRSLAWVLGCVEIRREDADPDQQVVSR